ncbi:Uma2 family endonuclease [Microcoleus sp.]|uniref:Uma2 family endonuclease n=1 Tax=Microcoleus sp. TaxID=44472 RepID=UPI0035938DEF
MKRYPKLTAEVLSPSTKNFDCSDKFADYQQPKSLEEYVLISQDEMRVECRRQVQDENGERWETVVYGAGDRAIFQSIQLDVAIEDLYRGVSLAP